MNNTLEEYKKAIKIKYEIEKDGEYFDFLYHPSRGKLRDLCWLIFEDNPTQDDLKVFRNLLCVDFDYTQKNKFKNQKDKFRPIETFFKGETDPTNIDAINLAAVLVDFQPRPFKKFNEKCRIEEAKQTKNVAKDVTVEIDSNGIEENVLLKNENEESKEVPEKENLMLNFKDLFSKEMVQKIYPRKIITIAVGTVALVSSACLYLVQKKD
ncbi:hypothetical protein [Flavobacterium nitrogenifigens]|uniref:Uncharacterized protein n=1 Tax=Flavobacterium nitrogenifigens TaxID=1617283 RepID=A0A521DNN9_9FLAO|nr:hypothetical protein [Flavobacterium nitrogenifigens]KAF2329918.1 hypothetical protein DM397_14355 [Flavobacterium nitrogenifigens]SMO73347.1 hypothetical protein SAMN06265220_103256 [Flavobacterium nitrogenifigens]